MFSKRFWIQTGERVAVGAAIGGSGAYILGMSAWDLASWSAIGDGAVWGALLALAASIAGSRTGNPDSPLATAPKGDPR